MGKSMKSEIQSLPAAIFAEFEKRAEKAVLIPIERLQDLKEDFAALQLENEFNDFQKFIVNELYQFDLPQAEFEIRSLLLAASPNPSELEITFSWQGRQFPLILPASYANKERIPAEIERQIQSILEPIGHFIKPATQLPRKRLAVRSGLGLYGRNNICFVDGMGSFANLSLFYTSLPCKNDAWYPVRCMPACQNCQICVRNCPTGAIQPSRFLIDNEKCLTYFNEAGGEWQFPQWISPSAHHAVYGCLKCQVCCPVNKAYLQKVQPPFSFTEEETAALVEGKAFDLFPPALQQKVRALKMGEYLEVLPRNLKALFAQSV
jgi:epoxyqueuosine reductase